MDPLDTDSVKACAEQLGIHVEGSDLDTLLGVLDERLTGMERFLSESFPVRPAAQSDEFKERHSYLPSTEEDPYRAWNWKTNICERRDGILSNKRIGFKEHVCVAGVPQTIGVDECEPVIGDCDATVVSRVLESGGTVIGKNRMRNLFGESCATLNPHDTSRDPGGSSSGCAVAVATRDVDIAFGGDQGGSIRIPAAYSGVLGLKPTFGLVSHFGAGFGFESSVDHIGPLALHATDLALALDAVSGIDGRDSRQLSIDRVDEKCYPGIRGGIDGVRIGILSEGFADPIDARVRASVMSAVDGLAGLGAKVERVSIPVHSRVRDVFSALVPEGVRAVHEFQFYGTDSIGGFPTVASRAMNEARRRNADLLPVSMKVNLILGSIARMRFGGAVYVKAANLRQSITQAYDSTLEEFDLLLMPTVRQIAPLLGMQIDGSGWRRADWIFSAYTYNTLPFNYTGHPALAVPCGKVDGLPVSFQVVSKRWQDSLLTRLALAYEEAVDWEAITAVPN